MSAGKTTPQDTVDQRNAQTSREEIAQIRAELPKRIFAYARVERGASITTWTGEAYGRITDVRQSFKSNFGDKRQSFRCLIFGTEYAGMAYLDSGDYVRLQKLVQR